MRMLRAIWHHHAAVLENPPASPTNGRRQPPSCRTAASLALQPSDTSRVSGIAPQWESLGDFGALAFVEHPPLVARGAVALDVMMRIEQMSQFVLAEPLQIPELTAFGASRGE